MATKKKQKQKQKRPAMKTALKVGDVVMVVSGGHKKKRPNKGQTGKLLRFSGKQNERVVVEGLNMVTRHQRETQPGAPSGRIQKEAAIHISNVMYYSDELKQPVRLKHEFLDDGAKVRGYMHPEKKEFVQLAS